MPTPAKTSSGHIVEAALQLLESGGTNAVTTKAIAEKVGIKAPSLYKHFPDRAAILAEVELLTFDRLRSLLETADVEVSPRKRLESQAHIYRRFARENPQAYALVYSADSVVDDRARSARLAAVSPVIANVAALVGETEALPATRTLTSFLHGFLSIELADLFRLAPGVNEAFEYGLALLLDGLEYRRTR